MCTQHALSWSQVTPFLCSTLTGGFLVMAARVGDGGGTGSARHRRERRLRSFLRHERMAVAMALSEFKHHSSRGQRGPGERYEFNHTAESQKHFSPRAVPGHPVWVRRGGPHVGLERHFLEHMADICPFVQILDAPVPQPVENVTGHLAFPGSPDCRAGHCSAQDLLLFMSISFSCS